MAPALRMHERPRVLHALRQHTHVLDRGRQRTPALTRPCEGLKPTRPHSADGTRTEPPVSVPNATGTMPAATAAALPALDRR